MRSSGCSESKLKQILNTTENLLNNSDTKSTSSNSGNALSSRSFEDICYGIETNKGTKYEKIWQSEANKRGIDCKNFSDSSEEICLYAYNKITGDWSTLPSYNKYVEKAKKLGLSCKSEDKKTLKENIIKSTNSISNKTKDAEEKCTEIGFKKGTEKYGDCVLKMLELK